MISESDLMPCGIKATIQPGDIGVTLLSTKARVTVLEVFEIKPEAYKPSEGKVAYRIDAGSGPELVMAHQLHGMGARERDIRTFYVSCRHVAVDRGMSKEEFDRRMKLRFEDMNALENFLRASMTSPAGMMNAVHQCFAFINLCDSPIQRSAMLAELCWELYLASDVLQAEWDAWLKKTIGQNGQQLADDAVKAAHAIIENHES